MNLKRQGANGRLTWQVYLERLIFGEPLEALFDT